MLLKIGRQLPRRSPTPISMERVRRILVFQDGGLGDIFRVFPIIKILRTRFPEKEIFLLRTQRPDVAQLMPSMTPPCHHLLLDMSKGYASKLREIAQLKRQKFDLVIGPSRGDGVLECAAIAWLTGSPLRVGFDSRGSGFLYTHTIPFDEDEQKSIVVQNVELLRFLGIEETARNIEFELEERDLQFGKATVAPFVENGERVVSSHLWATSHSEFRTWDIENFARLFGHLAEHAKCRILLLGGPSEAPAAQELVSRIGHSRVTNLTGSTSLAQTAAIIRSSHAFIGNDSSLLHIANAWRIPSAAFFGATAPGQVLPPDHRCLVIQAPKSLQCRPCYRHQPVFAYRCDHDFECLKSIPLDHVIRRLSEWLRDYPPPSFEPPSDATRDVA